MLCDVDDLFISKCYYLGTTVGWECLASLNGWPDNCRIIMELPKLIFGVLAAVVCNLNAQTPPCKYTSGGLHDFTKIAEKVTVTGGLQL